MIALQESERQQALELGIPAERIEIIPNGLDTTPAEAQPEPGSFRRQHHLTADRPLILFLGRINRKKGVDMLVHAFSRLHDLDAQLVIVGPDDGQLAEVKALVAQYGLQERVTLTGLLSGDAVTAAFQDADLFVLPCRADTFPVTIMEACQAGTPMVVTDRCEIAHLVQDRVADVVPFDADAFAAAMRRLLTDSDRYARYRANCAQVMADTFSVQAVVDRLEALYARVVREKRQEGNVAQRPA